MIKFWKSAAKGKSGFPVRPPEPQPSSSTKHISLELVLENEDLSQIFIKKSRLSLTLSDILEDRNSLRYFLQYMQTIDKAMVIKCWVELEGFRLAVMQSQNRNTKEELSCTKSFDLDWNSYSEHQALTSLCSDKISVSPTKKDRRKCKSVYSSSSCQNLSEIEVNNFLANVGTYNSENKSNNFADTAVVLFKKYVALEASQPLDLPDSVRKTVITNICHPQGEIKEDCFNPVLDLLYNSMKDKYFCEFERSPLYLKAQIDILTSGTLNLNDILFNETILFYFTEYLEQECCSVLLELIMALNNFRDNLGSGQCNSDQAQEDAIVIYDKYFSLQATYPIGFSTDIRLEVESEICKVGGPVLTCFDSPHKIVFKTLSHYVQSFLESELYYKYLSEMVNSVEQMWSMHRRSQSDCSSEFSFSTQNTLLAMGDPVFHRKKRNLSVPDMTIDSNQLYNADSLWQRKRCDGLSLGRINSLGRFESKFEPDPDKKEKSVLKKMVSRFVPTNSKVDEEMAWQIAHMIVKDVTDLTMAPPESERDN